MKYWQVIKILLKILHQSTNELIRNVIIVLELNNDWNRQGWKLPQSFSICQTNGCWAKVMFEFAQSGTQEAPGRRLASISLSKQIHHRTSWRRPGEFCINLLLRSAKCSFQSITQMKTARKLPWATEGSAFFLNIFIELGLFTRIKWMLHAKKGACHATCY